MSSRTSQHGPSFRKGFNVADAAGPTRYRRHGRIIETKPDPVETVLWDAFQALSEHEQIGLRLLGFSMTKPPADSLALVRWKDGSKTVEAFTDLVALWTSESPGFRVPSVREQADRLAQERQKVRT